MHVVEIKMLRWMYGYTKCDKIMNEVIREKVVVASYDIKTTKTT